MSIVIYENKTFKLSGKLTIYKVSELKNKLLEAYNGESAKESVFFLDLSAVESVDAAILQLIFSLKLNFYFFRCSISCFWKAHVF
jgi:anti-anti-sigma regulatory factor